MTLQINQQDRRTVFSDVDGTTTQFSVNFVVDDETNIGVYVTLEDADPDPNTDKKALNVDYTVTIGTSGTEVNFGTAPASGATVVITGDAAFAYVSEFDQPTYLTGKNLDREFRHQIILMQQLFTRLTEVSLHFPINADIKDSLAQLPVLKDGELLKRSGDNFVGVTVNQATIDAGYKDAVRVATTSNLNGTYDNTELTLRASVDQKLTIDLVDVEAGDDVLVKDQNTQLENGIYRVSDPGSATAPWVLKRRGDSQSAGQFNQGDVVSVYDGNVQAAFQFIQEQDVTAVGTDAISYIQAKQAGNFALKNDLSPALSNDLDTANNNLVNSVGSLLEVQQRLRVTNQLTAVDFLKAENGIDVSASGLDVTGGTTTDTLTATGKIESTGANVEGVQLKSTQSNMDIAGNELRRDSNAYIRVRDDSYMFTTQSWTGRWTKANETSVSANSIITIDYDTQDFASGGSEIFDTTTSKITYPSGLTGDIWLKVTIIVHFTGPASSQNYRVFKNSNQFSRTSIADHNLNIDGDIGQIETTEILALSSSQEIFFEYEQTDAGKLFGGDRTRLIIETLNPSSV